MMTVGPRELEPLHKHCTRAELESFACVICEGIVMDMLKAAKKNPQTGTLALSDEQCAHLGEILRYVEPEQAMPNGLETTGLEFLASGLVPALDVTRSIVLCRQVPVYKLGKAVAELEKSEESVGKTDSSSAGALFQYLLGKGRPFLHSS